MELTALDFQQARVKQVLFKSRLRSVLYGVREAEPGLFSMKENPLGQWLTTVLKPQYGHRPEVATIERLLRQTLDTGQGLVRQYQRGELEQARTGLEQIERLATEIEQQLTSVEHHKN
ncbi:hypothetical protein [Hymenobacter sp. BRD67]|uniref:hypothetical protein n=1 Tax=Hymenobacter sp. BRD67 TaxID=2675877 RepID=UPI001564E4DD|nr:hypothetical protein [Hymenobacter sp. BRD67]QKG52837.1 hypothetical protein GKZ67_09770 [Hymenobacter sp. BRD67]